MRSGHAPLNQYLYKDQQKAESACKCRTGIETLENVLYICLDYIQKQQTLLKSLKTSNLEPSKAILYEHKAFQEVAEYCDTTWWLKDSWFWERNWGGIHRKGPSPSLGVKCNTTPPDLSIHSNFIACAYKRRAALFSQTDLPEPPKSHVVFTVFNSSCAHLIP